MTRVSLHWKTVLDGVVNNALEETDLVAGVCGGEYDASKAELVDCAGSGCEKRFWRHAMLCWLCVLVIVLLKSDTIDLFVLLCFGGMYAKYIHVGR